MRQVGRDYGLGRTRFVRDGRAHLSMGGTSGESGMPRGHNLQPVQVGADAPHREVGQSVESVESMIARVLAGESARQVVESVLGRK